jgi:DNA-binding Xre family transcriptional regulator
MEKKMIRWRLRELLGEYQQMTGDKITYEEITAKTALSPNTLSLIAANKTRRTNFVTIEKLLSFFSDKLGRQLSVDDLLSRPYGKDITETRDHDEENETPDTV